MAVRRKPNGSWIADQMVGYKKGMPIKVPERLTKTCKTEEEAKLWDTLFKIEKMRRSGKTERTSSLPSLNVLVESDITVRSAFSRACANMTVSEFIQLAFWPLKRALRANTVKGYQTHIANYIIPYLGDIPVKDVSYSDIQRMLYGCTTRGIAKKVRETTSSILGVACNIDAIDSNPAGKRYDYPTTTSNPSRRRSSDGVVLATFAEHAKLMEHVHKYHAGELVERAVCTGLCLGLRPEEVSGLDLENIDIPKRTVRIDQVHVIAGGMHLERPKTDSGIRNVPMNEYYSERMSEWKFTSQPNTRDLWEEPAHSICINTQGNRASLRSIGEEIRKLRRERYDDGTELPQITQWSLRHSFGTAMACEAKIDIEVLREIMGHKDSSTTRIYIRPNYNHLIEAVSVMDNFYH